MLVCCTVWRGWALWNKSCCLSKHLNFCGDIRRSVSFISASKPACHHFLSQEKNIRAVHTVFKFRGPVSEWGRNFSYTLIPCTLVSHIFCCKKKNYLTTLKTVDVPAGWKVLGWLYVALVMMRAVCVHALLSQSLLALLSKRLRNLCPLVSTNELCRKADAWIILLAWYWNSDRWTTVKTLNRTQGHKLGVHVQKITVGVVRRCSMYWNPCTSLFVFHTITIIHPLSNVHKLYSLQPAG